MIHVIVPGQPIAQGRVRTARGIHYTPKRTRTWQGVARTAAATAMGETPLLEGPLMLDTRFIFDVPASWPQWKREAALSGVIVPAGKPDLDNLVKNVKDALTQVVWHDDTQVVMVGAEKMYGERPQTEATIDPMGAHAPQSVRKRDIAEL